MQDEQIPAEDETPSWPRRKYLPVWVTFFCWLFIVTGLFCLISIVLGMFDMPVLLTLYGISTDQVFSPEGVTLLVLFLLKAGVSISLLCGKKWAVDLAIADGVLGVVICVWVSMQVYFRAELLALGLYLFNMWSMRVFWKEWDGFSDSE